MMSLFSIPLESWHTILQWSAAILVGITFLVGIATVWVGDRVNRRQTERIAGLEKATAEAKQKQAEAERENAEAQLELKNRLLRSELPRSVFAIPLIGFLKELPKGTLEILYAPNDEEAYQLAWTISSSLGGEGGWNVALPKPISADDPSQLLPQRMAPEFGKDGFNLPLLTRVGGITGMLTVLVSPADFHDGFPRAGTASNVLVAALMKCGFSTTYSVDDRLPAGHARLVIGPK
jgi:hypothetical protein